MHRVHEVSGPCSTHHLSCLLHGSAVHAALRTPHHYELLLCWFPMDSFKDIPSYLLPSILSYIPFPHLQYRLVNKEWDKSMKISHSLGQCDECEICCPADVLLLRLQQLTSPASDGKKEMPWIHIWTLDNCSELLKLKATMNYVEALLIPFLDTLRSSSRCLSITLATNESYFRRDITIMITNWCLEHSNPTKYNFFCPVDDITFANEEQLSSFLRAPSMRHVTLLELGEDALRSSADDHRYPLTALRDSEAVCNLKSLTIKGVEFGSKDAESLVYSSHLTNLTHLQFRSLSGFDGMKGKYRCIGFETIICSPIMKNVKSFKISHNESFMGFAVVDAFAQSKYVKNLTHLSLSGRSDHDLDEWVEWPLQPLLRCDLTVPNLTSLDLREWCWVSPFAMSVITSPTSALFNRLDSLDFSFSTISVASMRVFCTSDGLKSLRWLSLTHATLNDECVELLASARFQNLEFLQLSHNYDLSNKAVVAIYSAKNIPNLDHLDIGYCHKVTSDVLKDFMTLPPRSKLKLIFYSFSITEECMRQAKAELKIIAPQLELMLG